MIKINLAPKQSRSRFAKIKMILTAIAILLMAKSAWAILEPASDLKNAPSNDLFIGYQWALFNHGQTIISDLDDIHPIQVKADPKVNINWQNFDALMKKDVVVAVLDSGVDGDHPELKGRVLPGINFSTLEPALRNLPDDDVGHGTHIAGIIAAISGNNAGIAGLSNRIKILPLKVYNQADTSGRSSNKKRVLIGDAVLKAVNYAIDQKVDVIHLSMGWARIANSQALTDAFQKAMDNGIVVVAAAGNDYHQAQIYPCAFRGVICVTSVGIDGVLSSFSNFGGHVDLAAPGEEILSTIPTVKDSERFGPKGFDLKTGSSQAAPFVSGAAAILKGIYPNASPNEIRARLMVSAKPFPKEVLFGFLDIKAAINANPNNFIAPVFKGIEQAEVDAQGNFDLPVIIERQSNQQLNFDVQSDGPGIAITNVAVQNETDQELDLKLKAHVKDLSSANKFSYSVKINGRTYSHQIILAKPLNSFQVTRYHLSNPSLIAKSDISTLVDPRYTDLIQQWTTEKMDADPKKNGLKLTVWRAENGQVIEKSLLFENLGESLRGFGLISNDWDMDGKTDYLFAGTEYEDQGKDIGKAKAIHFYYLNSDLKITKQFDLKFEGVYPVYTNLKDLLFGQITTADFGTMLVPVFWDTGLIPAKDKNPDPFEFEQNVNARRLYYFEPALENGRPVFITRTLTASSLEKYLRSTLNADVTIDIEGLGSLPQTRAEQKTGQINLAFTVGRGLNVNIFNLAITDLSKPFSADVRGGAQQINMLSKQSVDVTRNAIADSWDVSSNQIESNPNFQAIFSNMAARSLIWKGSKIGGINLTVPERGEQIIGILKTYLRGSDIVGFYETTNFVRIQGQWDKKAVDSKIAVNRTTFLPGSVLSQAFEPLIIGPDKKPSLMLDSSRVFNRIAEVYTLNSQGQLQGNINRSLKIPENCETRAPLWSSIGTSRLALLCKENSEYFLNVIDLN